MKIKYLGHSAFSIRFGGHDLIIDPFISGNENAKNISIDDLAADYIMLTHGHQDHVLDAEVIAKRTSASIISNYEIVSWYGEKGISGQPLNHGGKHEFPFGTVKYVNAIHSSVLPDGTYGGNPGGFVIWNEGKCFYIAGDTALTYDMKLIPELCPKLDFAILPIGDNFTMGHEEALIASDFIQCDTIVACHYDTFDPIKIDKESVRMAFRDSGKTLHMPSTGEEISF